MVFPLPLFALFGRLIATSLERPFDGPFTFVVVLQQEQYLAMEGGDSLSPVP